MKRKFPFRQFVEGEESPEMVAIRERWLGGRTNRTRMEICCWELGFDYAVVAILAALEGLERGERIDTGYVKLERRQ